MTKLAIEAIPAMLVASILATSAHAQAPAPTPTPAPEATNRPAADTDQRLMDGRIAAARATLRMTDAQARLWASVEAQVRASQAAALKRNHDRMENARQPAHRVELPDRLQMIGDRLAERAERAKAFASAFAPFYASLAAAQKHVVGHVIAQLQSPLPARHARTALRHSAVHAGQPPR